MATVSRLIKHFIPTHYDLTLKLERVERKFSGTVTLTGESTPDSDVVKLHGDDTSKFDDDGVLSGREVIY